ncbi:hypothetical protein JCM19376_16650 [Fusibacter bizertensis]
MWKNESLTAFGFPGAVFLFLTPKNHLDRAAKAVPHLNGGLKWKENRQFLQRCWLKGQ